MKASIVRGNGFGKLVSYILDDEKGAEIVSSNMSGETSKELSAEFEAIAELRPEAKNPVWHCSLSLVRGETASAEKWNEIIKEHLKNMGVDITNNQYIGVIHKDKEHEHVHIALNRVGLDGKLWSNSNDVFKAIDSTQKIEESFGLALTKGLEKLADKKSLSKNEVAIYQRTGEPPARLQLQDIIDNANKSSLAAFVNSLKEYGVNVRPAGISGAPQGISFEKNGVAFKGSALGKKYAWKQLSEQLKFSEKDIALIDDMRRENEINVVKMENQNGINERYETEFSSEVNVDRTAVRDIERDRFAEASDGNRGFTSESAGSAGALNDTNGTRNPSDDSRSESIARSGARENKTSDFIGRSLVRETIENSAADGNDFKGREKRIRNDESDNRLDGLKALSALPVVRGSVSFCSELASTLKATTKTKPDDRDYHSKSRAWAMQSAALESPKYRLTLVFRGDEKMGLATYNLGKKEGKKALARGVEYEDKNEKLFTKDEISERIDLLRKENARGFEIYLTPIDDDHHYILVDDVKPEALDELKLEHSVALVQQSSANNQQAIIKIRRDKTLKNEQSVANNLVTKLNKKFGDPKLSGVIHSFRMAGFANMKPGKSRAYTKVLEAKPVICNRLEKIMADARAEAVIDTNRKEARRRVDMLNMVIAETKDTKWYSDVYRKTAQQLKKVFDGREDWSSIDFRCGKEIIKEGGTLKDVQDAIIENSPLLYERHGASVERYMASTLSKLKSEPDVSEILEERAVQAQRSTGESYGLSR